MNSVAQFSGTELRLLRQRRNLSQAKLALLLDVPQAHLSQWELEKIPVSHGIEGRVHSLLGNLDDCEIGRLRKKRYQRHEYVIGSNGATRTVTHSRSAIAANREYLELLARLEAGRNFVRNDSPTAISLFAGCGGMSLGFSWAGFHVKGFVELKPGFRAIYKKNFPATQELGSDITRISDGEIAEWVTSFGPIDVLFGGPPCQGFSLTGKRDRFDPRNELFQHFVRIAKILKPKAVLLENVRLLTSMKSKHGKLVKDEIGEAFRKIGYQMNHKELDAQDFGVPQHRERVFFIGIRADSDLLPSFPEFTHGKSNEELFASAHLPLRTFRTATCDLEILESGQKSNHDQWHEAVAHPQHVIEWLKDVPEGASAHDNPDPAMRPPSGYNTTYKRLCWDEPASTVSTTFGMISGCRNVHPTNTRSLTVREALRCQSFPDTFKLTGNLGSIRTSIGNAVPPLLAYVLANHLKQNLFRQD
jgi:DNA (cytosine-5)-methyltransferase 1